MFCFKCGRNFPDNAQFCLYCGEPLKKEQISDEKKEIDIVKKKYKHRKITLASIGTIILIFGFLFGFTNLPSMLGNPKINLFPVNTPASAQTSEEQLQTIQPSQIQQPSQIIQPEIELVIREMTREMTGANKTVNYSVYLNNFEIIVGQSYGFSYKTIKTTGGGSAFIIKGPGSFSFKVTDGEWIQYSNVATDEQSDELLQEKIDYCMENYYYTLEQMKISRIP